TITGTETVGGLSTGVGAQGKVDQQGATVLVNTLLNIGDATQGAYSLTAGTLTAANENLGNNGTGSFTQSGGTHTATVFNIGTAVSGIGSYTLSGTGVLNSTTETQAVSGASTFIQN